MPAPCSVRPTTTSAIVGAVAATTSPTANTARLARYGLRRSVAIGQFAGGHESDEVGQRVARERDAVEGVAVELVGDRGQRGDHRRDLERDHHDPEHQPDRQEPLLANEPGGHAVDR